MSAAPDYQRASDDLLYEIQMLYMLRDYLAGEVLDTAFKNRADKGLPARNASIEAFALHLRSLIAFFYNIRGRSGGAHDLIANDYVRDRRAYARARPKRGEGSVLGPDIVDRVHKQVAHLTLARNAFPPEQRVWLYEDVCQALAPVIRAFLAYIDPSKVVPDFVQQVERLGAPPSVQDRKIDPVADPLVKLEPSQPVGGTATIGIRLPRPYVKRLLRRRPSTVAQPMHGWRPDRCTQDFPGRRRPRIHGANVNNCVPAPAKRGHRRVA